MEELLKNVEEKIGYTFDKDYADYILGLRPLKLKLNLFKTKSGEEKVLRCLLSFEENDRNYILKFQDFDSEYKARLVPFAMLEFGDLICFDRDAGGVVLYNHELDEIQNVANSFTDFLGMLYGDILA